MAWNYYYVRSCFLAMFFDLYYSEIIINKPRKGQDIKAYGGFLGIQSDEGR
tara:strand:+ start:111 stop:263 length:153 start_codon:yes stop_codon:yes gene_type:complete